MRTTPAVSSVINSVSFFSRDIGITDCLDLSVFVQIVVHLLNDAVGHFHGQFVGHQAVVPVRHFTVHHLHSVAVQERRKAVPESLIRHDGKRKLVGYQIPRQGEAVHKKLHKN